MKILFVTDLYPIKAQEKATPRALHDFVTEWVKMGIEVDVIRPNFLFNSFLRKKPFYKSQKFEFERINIYNVNYMTPFLFNTENKIKKMVDFNSYDIIVAHMPSGIIFADRIAKKYKKPLICGVHNSDIEVLTKPFYKNYFKKKLEDAYTSSNKIACRSFVLQKRFLELFPNFEQKTFVAPSGIDKNFINEKEISFSSPIKVITCANLIKRKNVDKIINAVKALESFELTVIGDGPELRKLKKLVNYKIKFLGRLEHKRVLEEMEKADIFILPSLNETFGLVYLEAMASGCITVCTKNDGIDGILLDKKNGFLCEPTIEGIKNILVEIKKWNDEGAEKARFFGAPTLAKIAENSLETVKKLTKENCAFNYIKNIT